MHMKQVYAKVERVEGLFDGIIDNSIGEGVTAQFGSQDVIKNLTSNSLLIRLNVHGFGVLICCTEEARLREESSALLDIEGIVLVFSESCGRSVRYFGHRLE